MEQSCEPLRGGCSVNKKNPTTRPERPTAQELVDKSLKYMEKTNWHCYHP